MFLLAMRKPIDHFVLLFALAAAACGNGNMPPSTKDMATVQNGADMTMVAACGAVGQACCTGDMCTDKGAMCTMGMCTMPPAGAPTGAPCATDKDCDGTKPVCITKSALGVPWPGGYCSAPCNPLKNDPKTGLNPGCPGTGGTCAGSGNQGNCFTYCTGSLSKPNDHPCTRTGYLCFGVGNAGGGCEPAAFSECTPDKPTSCPQDGGVNYPAKTDGGTPTYSGRVCTLVGNDLVGNCTDGCDVFAQNCIDMMGMQGCYADDINGVGTCAGVNSMGQDGDACTYTNDCNPGLGCYYGGGVTGMGTCRPYCRVGGMKPVACTNGKTCVDHSNSVKSSVVGNCAG